MPIPLACCKLKCFHLDVISSLIIDKMNNNVLKDSLIFDVHVGICLSNIILLNNQLNLNCLKYVSQN